MLRAEVAVLWLLIALLACDADSSGKRNGKDDTALEPRERVLMLCDRSCEVRAEGDDCETEDYLAWCLEACRTIDGMLPDDCLDEAETALLCWIDEDWYCTGETSYYGIEQPLPEDEEACEKETEAFYLCG